MNEMTSEGSARVRARRNTSTQGPIISPPTALLVAALMAVAGLSSDAEQADHALASQADHVPGRLLLQPKPGVPELVVQGLVARSGARQVGAIQQINVRVLQVPPAALPSVLAALQHNQNVEFAEPDYLVEPALTPNDTYYSLEWHLPKMQAPQAWDITTGSSQVTIAILDSGVDATHPDLSPLIVPGWNVFDNSADTSDMTGHGTGVAGNAAAVGNNGVGIAALAWNCRIMPIRVADPTGCATDSMLAAGLTYAADHGARVANASFGISGLSSTLSSAAQYFQSKGGVFTGSAGNDGTFDSTADDPYILRISATDSSDVLASFSSTGNNIDLCAPGVSIVTTTKGGGYGYATGTSASAPLVAGVAALVLSVNPSLTGSQVQQILKQSADGLGATGWDSSYGWGRVNALKAVQAALNPGSGDSTPPSVQIAAPTAGSVLAGVAAINISGSDNVAVTRVEFYLNGTGVATNANAPATYSWDTTLYGNGSYTLQARAYDAAGNVGTSTSVPVTVQNPVPDTTPPTAQITAPANGSTLSGTVSVKIAASDNVGVTLVEYYLNGTLAGSGGGATTAFSWNTTLYPNGSYTLQVRAYDAAGNVGTSALLTVSVRNSVPDTTPPAVRIASPTGGTITAKTTPVSVAASDNVAVTRVDLLVDGKKYGTSTSATPTFNWNTSKLSRGSHTLQSLAYDAAGNSARSSIVTVSK
jgi:thermitase